MSNSARVHVIDDDPALRNAIVFLLATGGLTAMQFDSAEAFIEAFSPSWRGCILADVRMGGMSGLELFDRLSAMGCRLPYIILTGHGDVPMAVEALKKGARDFVEKPFDGNTLVDKLAAAIEADAVDAEARLMRQMIDIRLQSLSEREREVMGLMLAGKLNKVVAGELGIAIRTVEAHRAKILEKLGVKNAVELSNLLAAHRHE